MSEPFKFSFSGDDIEDDDAQEQQQQTENSGIQQQTVETEQKKNVDAGRPAKYHSLDDMV